MKLKQNIGRGKDYNEEAGFKAESASAISEVKK